MKKHHKKSKMKTSSAKIESPAEEAGESMSEEQAEGAMKKGGKVKKKSMKVEGGKMKSRLDKPAKKAAGGSVLDSTNSGITPSSPFAIGSPQRKGDK